MSKKRNYIIGASLVAVLGVAAIVSTQLPKPDEKIAEAVNDKAADTGLPFAPQGGNTKELNKLNAMQAEIAKMGDDAITKEIEDIKVKAQELGIIGSSRSKNPNVAKNQEAKDMMLRMALLRVEIAKRIKKPVAAEKQDS